MPLFLPCSTFLRSVFHPIDSQQRRRSTLQRYLTHNLPTPLKNHIGNIPLPATSTLILNLLTYTDLRCLLTSACIDLLISLVRLSDDLPRRDNFIGKEKKKKKTKRRGFKVTPTFKLSISGRSVFGVEILHILSWVGLSWRWGSLYFVILCLWLVDGKRGGEDTMEMMAGW